MIWLALLAARVLLWGHPHRPVRTDVRLDGVDHVGAYDMCWCGAVRAECDHGWRRVPGTTVRTVHR
jgi:hypothetical protein